MIKVFLIVYSYHGIIIDTLPTASFNRCFELSARLTMIDFMVPAQERFRYDCKSATRKMISDWASAK